VATAEEASGHGVMEDGRVSLVGAGFGRVPVVVAQRRASLVTHRGVCVGWPHLPGHDPVGSVAANALAPACHLRRARWAWRPGGAWGTPGAWRPRGALRTRGWWRGRGWWWHEHGVLVDLLGYSQYPPSVLVAGFLHSRQHHTHQTFPPLRVGREHACTGSKGSIDKFTRMVVCFIRFVSFRFVHHGLLRACIHRSSGNPCTLSEAGHSS
jgi:hypothetical protein